MYLTTLLTMGLMCSNRWLFQQPFLRDLPFKINTYEFMLMVRCNWHTLNLFFYLLQIGFYYYSRRRSWDDGESSLLYLHPSGSCVRHDSVRNTVHELKQCTAYYFFAFKQNFVWCEWWCNKWNENKYSHLIFFY